MSIFTDPARLAANMRVYPLQEPPLNKKMLRIPNCSSSEANLANLKTLSGVWRIYSNASLCFYVCVIYGRDCVSVASPATAAQVRLSKRSGS